MIEIGTLLVGIAAGGGACAWFMGRMMKADGEKITDLIDRCDTLAGQTNVEDIVGLVRNDRQKFLDSMTRDELAAYDGNKDLPVVEDLYEFIRNLLKDWHKMRMDMLTAQAAANASAVRDTQHAALQAANAELVEIIAGTRARLATSNDSPFGIYTGRFPTFARLALFLIDQALRAPGMAQAPPESAVMHPSQSKAQAPPEDQK